MHVRTFGVSGLVRAGIIVLLAIASLSAQGRTRADCERDSPPRNGERGKDVIWVPTSDFMVARMLELAKVGPEDVVYDLGAGDGKIAITAARRHGATAVGIEYNPNLVRYAKCLVEVAGVTDRVSIHEGDFFTFDFSEATVVTLYLLPALNVKLRPRLLDLRPGTRVVSHSFPMGEWKPDDRSVTPFGRAYLWIVPAKVAGDWQFVEQEGSGRFTVHLEQHFQELTGTAGAQKADIEDGRLRGAGIEFSFEDDERRTRVTGQVEGDRIEARVTRGRTTSVYVGKRTRAGVSTAS